MSEYLGILCYPLAELRIYSDELGICTCACKGRVEASDEDREARFDRLLMRYLLYCTFR